MAASQHNPKPLPAPAAELQKIAEKFGTPYQLYDEQHMVDNVKALICEFKAAGFDFTQFYAVKALPNPAILKLLVGAGCGLDCSSTAELYIARKLGVPGNQIMYTSNYTSAEDLAWAVNQGVILNLDDASLVDTVATNGEFPELISFRLNPGLGRTDSSTKSNVLGGPDAKFGVPPDQILAAYKAAAAAGATRFGIHMMTGSCVLKEEYWSATVAVLVDTMAKIQHELGIERFDFVNIGGGMGLAYTPDEKPVDVPSLVQRLKRALNEKLDAAGVPPPKHLYMENGRFITGPYGWLVSRVHAVKHAFGAKYLGVDANMAHLMRPGMYGSYHHISVPLLEEQGGTGADRVPTNVVGTLCENNDWFAKDRPLAQDAGVGDLVVVHDTGAHSASMGFQYNGKLRAPELLLRRNGDVQLIRHRETYDTLYSNTRLPEDLTVDGKQLSFEDGPTVGASASKRPTKAKSQEVEPTANSAAASSAPPAAQSASGPATGVLASACVLGAALGAGAVFAFVRRNSAKNGSA